jgi:hypothetical protein
MAILVMNPAGNTPQGDNAEGETFTFAPAPEPGGAHGDGIVLLYGTLPAIQSEHPAGDIIRGNFIGTDSPSDITLGQPSPDFGSDVVDAADFVVWRKSTNTDDPPPPENPSAFGDLVSEAASRDERVELIGQPAISTENEGLL